MKRSILFLILIALCYSCKTVEPDGPMVHQTKHTGVVYTFDNPVWLKTIHVWNAKADTAYCKIIGYPGDTLVGDSLTYEIVYDLKTISKYFSVNEHTGILTICSPELVNKLGAGTYSFKVRVSNKEGGFYGLIKVAKHDVSR